MPYSDLIWLCPVGSTIFGILCIFFGTEFPGTEVKGLTTFGLKIFSGVKVCES